MREIAVAPLAGYTVVETGRSVAAGFCTRLLAHVGAQVLVVEPLDGAAGVFLGDGKRVDGVTAQDAYAAADVVVHGADRGDSDPDPGAEFERLQAFRPGLVYVFLSPFGRPGDGLPWRGDDINSQATGGLSSLVGEPEREPLVVPDDVGASGQGLSGACAVLGALLDPDRDGSFIDVAAADVAASYSRMYTLLYRFYDIPPVRAGRRAPGSGGRYPMTILPCRDGDVVLIGRSRRDWERYLDMLGRPEWSEQPRYRDPLGIATQYPDEVDALIAPWLAKRTRSELGELAQKYGVPLGAVRTVDEVLDDPQMRHRGFFRPASDTPGVELPGFPALFKRP